MNNMATEDDDQSLGNKHSTMTHTGNSPERLGMRSLGIYKGVFFYYDFPKAVIFVEEACEVQGFLL